MPTIYHNSSATDCDVREGSNQTIVAPCCPSHQGTNRSCLLPPNHEQQLQDHQPKELCFGCQRPIEDRFLLRVMENSWHERCLHCSICLEPLRHSCFIKDRRLLCRLDYDKLYGVRCGGCNQTILSNELVMRAMGNVYHVTCFVCVVCRHQLQKGDQFVANESEIYCRLDFEKKFANFIQLSPKSSDWFHTKSEDESSVDDNDADHPKGPKRPRTILTTSQRRKFKASFEVNPKPCRKVRETLAAETGLSVRVVQVWFQNQRAKMKKLARRQTEDSQTGAEKGKKNAKNKVRKDEDVSDSSVPPSDGGSNLTALALCSENKRPLSENQMTSFSNHSSQDMYSTSNSGAGSESVYTSALALDGGNRQDNLDDLLTGGGQTPQQVVTHVGGQRGSILNPIDKLYSMQNSYFSVD